MSQSTTRRYTASSSGNNTLISVSATQYLIVKQLRVSPEATITGEVKLLVGTTELGGVRNPVIGGGHTVVDNGDDGEKFPSGDDLIVNLPDTTAVTVTATYVLEDE